MRTGTDAQRAAGRSVGTVEPRVLRPREIAQGMALAAFFVVVSPLAQSDDPGAHALDVVSHSLAVISLQAGVAAAATGSTGWLLDQPATGSSSSSAGQ